MARFTDLPPELRLRIATFLRASSMPFRDLKAFALVCRDMAPIAQEVLLREPVLNNFTLHNTQDRSGSSAPAVLNQMQQLAETFLASNDVVASDPRAVAAITQFAGMSLEKPELMWRERLEQLDQTLRRVPKLAQKTRSLDIKLLGSADIQIPANASISRIVYPAERVAALISNMPELEYFSIMFKSEFERSHPVHNGWLDVVWAKIVSFDRLKTLKTNFLPPDRVLMIPSLRTLHIDLQEFRNRREFHLVFDTMSEGSDSQVVPSVSNLIVDLNMSFFEERTPGSSHDEVCSQMMNFMEYLCDCRELKTVQLRLCYDDGDGIHHLPPLTRSEELLYNDLMPFFGRLNTVETLIIDSNDVDWDLYARNDGVNDKPYSLWTAKHQQPLFAGDEANELIDMSGLRRLVAPQEAFFSHVDPEALSDFHGNGYQFEPTLLPSSVESIEIIDSTRALNRWARYVLELPEEYPSLKIIVLWCDTHTDPFVDDDRIRPSGEPKRPDTIYYCFDGAKNVPETESDWRLEVDVSDKVWEEIEEAGISLVSTRSATADGARFREQHCYTIYPLMDAIK